MELSKFDMKASLYEMCETNFNYNYGDTQI